MIDAILELIYPSSLYCICCGRIIDRTRPYRLCNICMESIRWITGRSCNRCGKALSGNNTEEICYNCRAGKQRFDRGFAAVEYGEHEKSVIFSLKYDGRTDIAKTIAEIMHDRMEFLRSTDSVPEYDAIAPIPLHRKRFTQRGFNQAALIAESFAEFEGTGRYIEDALQRKKATDAMRGKTPVERRRNISGAFEVNKKHLKDIKGKKLMLVDDIQTTAFTIDEAAAALKAAGADKVYFCTFAAGADVVKSE